MRKLLRIFTLSCLMGWASTVKAQTETYNLGVSSVAWPQSSVLTKQPVQLTLHNYGPTTVTSFTVGVIKNDVKLFEEKYTEQELLKNSNLVLTLQGKVDMEYGETASMKIYAKVDGTDTNEKNDTSTFKVEMPPLCSYPYLWDASKVSDEYSGKWSYDSTRGNFYVSGRGTNINKYRLKTPAISFKEGDYVTCNFRYHVATEGTKLEIYVDYGETIDTIYSSTLSVTNGNEYADGNVSFKPKGTAQVIFAGSVEALGYGEIWLTDISFQEAVTDLKAVKVISPAIEKLVTSDDGYKVKVRYKNISPFNIESPTLCYSVGNSNVTEIYSGTLTEGEAIDYVFNTPLKVSTTGTFNLMAWCEAKDDGRLNNDTVQASYSFYDALDFPYTTTFDEGNDLWQTIDYDGDLSTWQFDSLENYGGCAYYPTTNTTSAEDYLLTPAIKMPAGRSRISFYYSGSSTSGSEHLTVLMGKSPDPTDMKTVLVEKDVNVSGWLNAYSLIDLDQADTYYFAFRATGTGNRIYLDNLHIDQEEDICINNITFDTESGFDKSTSKVTISYINHGVSAQKNITVRYYINNVQADEQTVTETVQPGDTLFYTFEKPADISYSDSTYTLKGEIVTVIGSDQNNDVIYGQSIKHWPTYGIPYSYGFDDSERNGYWTNESDTEGITSKWTAANVNTNAYSPKMVLKHSGKVTTGTKDWAYSECIYIPKGTYEVSFFYRTNVNGNKTTYLQNFSLNVGNDRTPQAMTTEIVNLDSVLVYGTFYKKFNGKIEIANDGKYYLGFCFTTSNCGTSSYLYIDDIEIKPISEGKALPYTADFAEEWTKYNSKSTNPNWTEYTETDNSQVERVQRTSDHVTLSSGFEDKLVSPKLKIEAGKKVTMTVNYALSSDSTNTALNIYTGHVDNSDSLKLVASMPVVADSAYTEYKYTFTATEADSCVYIGFRTNSPTEGVAGYVYDARIKQVTIDYDSNTGINLVPNEASTTISKREHTLHIAASSIINKVEVCDVSGQRVMQISPQKNTVSLDCSSLHGVYVVSVTTHDDKTVRKLIF